jgi:hypothetical protein
VTTKTKEQKKKKTKKTKKESANKTSSESSVRECVKDISSNSREREE